MQNDLIKRERKSGGEVRVPVGRDGKDYNKLMIPVDTGIFR
jgi:hypothetical protein